MNGKKLEKRVVFCIESTPTRSREECIIFEGDGEWVIIINRDVVNIYDNYEEFKESVMKLLLNK